jgi:hypothetical protein
MKQTKVYTQKEFETKFKQSDAQGKRQILNVLDNLKEGLKPEMKVKTFKVHEKY